MVELGEFGNVAGDIFGNVFTVTVGAFVVILILGVIGFFSYYFLIYKRKFDINVKVISNRAKDPNIVLDKGAILYDGREKENYLKLWGLKKELNIPPFNVMIKSDKGDYIELLRNSEDGFCFLSPPRIENQRIIRTNGKAYPVANIIQRQIELDSAWLIKRKARDRKTFDPDTLLSKLLIYAPQLISGSLMVILVLFLLNSLPDLINSLSALAQELSSLKGVANKI